MKFFDIKGFFGSTQEEVVLYLKERVGPGLKDLYTGLRKLDFTSNFSTFEWEGTITSGQTLSIANAFKTTPSGRIVVRIRPLSAGTVIIDDSTTVWTPETIYLRNSGTVSGRIKVIFFE